MPQPSYTQGSAEKNAVLLINLGTPDAPTPEALEPFLREFLSDARVIEDQGFLWKFILHGVILNTRPKQSAEKYARIWTRDGSPLMVHTKRLTAMLQGILDRRAQGAAVRVEYAMRYGNPGIPEVMARLAAEGCQRILAVPLYPQYAASSTATALDAVYGALMKMRNAPALRTIKHFHDHTGYVTAAAQNIRDYWNEHGRPEKLVMSFHGTPSYTHDAGDPYYCECQESGRLIAQALGLENDQYLITFQSRFGREEWLKPYTAATLAELGRLKTRRVDVVCPGFVADCLETLEEIALEVRDDFIEAGGGEYRYIPCLNERADWIEALAGIVMENLGGWFYKPDEKALELSRQLALAQGAAQ